MHSPPTDALATPARSAIPPWVITGLSGAVIVGTGAAAYANSFQGQFVFDDGGAIRDNPSIRSLWPLWPVLTAGTYTTIAGRPLLNLSLAINYAWGGLNPWGYHAVNLALHLLAALTLFGIVRRTLSLPSIPDRFQQHSNAVALSATLIWTLHPLQTESVTYIVQRAESLVGLFYLLTLYCTIRSVDSTRPLLWQIGAVVACLLGMASKEVMVSAPLIVLVYDATFLTRSLRETLRKRGKLYAAFCATWGLLAVLVVASGGRDKTAGFGYGLSSWDYAMTQWGAIAGYLRLCFFPAPLVLDYGTGIARAPAEIIPPAILIGLLICGTIAAFRFTPWIGFLGLAFFAILAPSSSFIPVASQTIAIHRMYLPLAAVAVLVTVLGWDLWWAVLDRFKGRGFPSQHPARWLVPLFVCGAVSLVFGSLTFLRNDDYQSVQHLWEDNFRKYPSNPRALCSAALESIYAGNDAAAVEMCNRALKIDSRLAHAYYVRGIGFTNQRDFERAFRDYSRSLELDPRNAFAHFHRGVVALQLHKDEDALASLSKATELAPSRPDYWLTLGKLLQRLDRCAEAAADFSQAIGLQPGNPDAYLSRGLCFRRIGRWDEAISDFTRVIELAPQFVAAYSNRALCFYDAKQFDRAWTDVRSVQSLGGQLDPEFIRRLSDATGAAP